MATLKTPTISLTGSVMPTRHHQWAQAPAMTTPPTMAMVRTVVMTYMSSSLELAGRVFFQQCFLAIYFVMQKPLKVCKLLSRLTQ